MTLAQWAASAALLPIGSGPEGATPVVVYASQSGMVTLDQDEQGGNPFASALVSLLSRPSLSLKELRSGLISLTKEKTGGFQVPDDSGVAELLEWSVKPVDTLEQRVAVVFVYSDYGNAGVSSLPGAERDLGRVTQALRGAGFEVVSTANPTMHDLHAALEGISSRSRRADAAVIYVTGHGYEHAGRTYLMPSNYPFEEGPKRLAELAVDVAILRKYLKAEKANVVFFGGCRSYW